jgi:ribosomal protein L11 methyltransferase
MPAEHRRFRIAATDAAAREILLAIAFDAGAEGAEEREVAGAFEACIYARSDVIDAVRHAVADAAGSQTDVDAVETLPDVDWSEAWREGLEAIVISPRLVVRPPFVAFPLAAGQREIVIDPGQAFGTGGHASTRLCLEWIDALAVEQPEAIADVLDVGTGSGVLALAAVALGARSATGFDLDPVAVGAARRAAIENGLAARVHLFAGGLEALAPAPRAFTLVVANLLKREMLPIASGIAARVGPSGRLVLAGLLEEDTEEVLRRFAREGLVPVGRRTIDDATGRWVGPCLAREG